MKQLFSLWLLLFLALPLSAQTPLDKGVICAGITKTIGAVNYAYLGWSQRTWP